MRNVEKDRAGFERMLAAVVAAFVGVAGTSALAKPPPPGPAALDPARDAAVPMPEPASGPRPTAADFVRQVKAMTGDAAKAEEAKSEPTRSEPVKSEPVKAESIEKPAEPVTTASTTPPAEAPKAATAPVQSTSAATPAPQASAPPSPVAAADQPLADKLRETLGAKTSKYFDRKNERTAVETFYAARSYAPLWTEGGALTARAKGVIARLRDAGRDGLDAGDYPVSDFTAATTPDMQADAELKLTAAMLDYARHAQSGRMHWSRVSADILYPEHPTDPAEVLANVTAASDASAALESYNPPHKLYRDLRAKLAELRGETETPHARIEDGPALRYVPAKKKQAETTPEDPRVPVLRARLGVENASDARYDAAVAAAVRKFQAGVDMKATGVLDTATVRALNSPKRDRQIDTVILNMERWRWLPRNLGEPKLGNAYVILNVPDFTLKVMQRDHQLWTTRVVTGKPGKHATPMLTETMKYITVNPTWNVPPSIIYNEYLPALQQDPGVLDRMGLKLTQNRDGSVHISQPPGERNALGRIRFNFPNKFLVYQHDTPDKQLFARDERAFSHGCMRVQNPDQYAEVLLGLALPEERYTAAKIRSMYGNQERDIRFPTPIPVNITYQTAFVDDAGKLQIRKDIYGRDAAMMSLLRGSKQNLEVAVSHAQPNYSRPRVAPVYASGNSEPNFFERLFGAPTQPQQAPPRPQRRVITR